MVLTRPRARSTTEINSENSLFPHRYFTEHLMDVFRKSEQFKPKTLEIFIRQLKKHTGDHLQQFALQLLIQTQDQISGS
jgi:hypothetical protein